MTPYRILTIIVVVIVIVIIIIVIIVVVIAALIIIIIVDIFLIIVVDFSWRNLRNIHATHLGLTIARSHSRRESGANAGASGDSSRTKQQCGQV
jgi:uncharacterized membrane protein YgcG